MSDDGWFPKPYQEFLRQREEVTGYEFQQALAGSVPPPVITFREKLRWWTWGRWRRLKTIRQERDKFQQEILQMRKGLSPRER